MKKPIKNNRLLNALRCQPVDYTPIWIMRQAGRYLPEYRELRKQEPNFLAFCKNPDLVCQATLQPLERFPLDAAIIFSDILTIADALELGLYFSEGEGPVFENPIRSEQDIKRLPELEIRSKLAYVAESIELVQQNLHLKVPLIGFAGSPWTQAAYIVEGRSSKTFSILKKMMYAHPTALHTLLEKLTAYTIDYLAMQIEAGVDTIMLFDTWGGILTQDSYLEFSLNYMTEITANIKNRYPDIPVILFTKGGSSWLEMMTSSGCDALGLDWTINIQDAKAKVGNHVALQGNLDPTILYATPTKIKEEVEKILIAYGNKPGHIFNLGHGIYPDVPPEHVEFLVHIVHELSKDIRKN